MKKKIFGWFTVFIGCIFLSVGLVCYYRPFISVMMLTSRLDSIGIGHVPVISVVMPTYNRIDLLPRSIESILNQTYQDFEFIIVDDGSTDGSVSLIQAYQQKDKRIRLIQNDKNRGIPYSRNRGMDAARGKYVAIMDSDDFSEPDRLQKSMRFFQKHPDYKAVNSVYHEMGKKGINNWVPPKRWEIIFNFSNYYTNLAVYDLNFVRSHHIRYDETLISAEDYDFWSKIWLAGGKLGMINEPLLRLRRHRSHSEEYYQNIKTVRKIVSARLLSRFGISNIEAVALGECELMAKMINSPFADKLVDSYVLNLTYQRQCTSEELPEGTLYVKHFDFVDYFLWQSNNLYIRQKTNEIYQLLSHDDSTAEFLNPSGEKEVYRIMSDGSLGLIENLN